MNRASVVVITGASAGVGRAAAHEFARHGAAVGLIARGAAALSATRAAIERDGGRAVTFCADVACADEVEAAAAAIEAELGPIDVWVNNAMVTVVSPVREVTADEVRRVTEVTYLGTVHGTLAALRRMLPRNRGSIVQVGSALAYRSIPLQAPYCGAKFAIRGFTDALRSELLHDRSRIRLTMVQMPALNTPQFDWCRTRMPRQPRPVPPVFQPQVAARAIVWASRHERRELFVGGSTWKAIVASIVAPGVADRWLARNGYSSQQALEPVSPDRVDNLWHSGPACFATHGRFDACASPRSPALWLTTHRRTLAATASALVVGVALGLRRAPGTARRSPRRAVRVAAHA